MRIMSLIPNILPPPNKTTKSHNTITIASYPKLLPTNNNSKHSLVSHLLSLTLSLSLNLSSSLPSSAIPFVNSPSKPPLLSPTTPFSQSKNLPIGLDNGKIRACPSINPSCVSTNPKSSNFEFPWEIPAASIDTAVQKLQDAILNTQKNATVQVVEDTSNGQYVRAVADGGFGKDLLEFLVRGDVVTYRCMATKVTYVYPFTTAFGDSKGQQERMKKIVDELGWYAPSFDSMD